MQDFCDRCFSRASLSLEENRCFNGRKVFDLLNQFLEFRAASDQATLEVRRFGSGKGWCAVSLRGKLLELETAFERGNQFVDAKRFLQVVEGTQLQRLDRALRAGIGRHDNDDRRGIKKFELL